jgi:hypothetical protein
MPYDSAGTWRHFKLFDATYRIAAELGAVTQGVATGGSTTTIVDTRILTQADDFYNQGMAWILRDAADGGAAPEAEFGEVTDFANSSSTATIGSVTAGSGNPFTAAVATGDTYAICTSKYPPHQLILAVNQVLREMGPVPFVDKTTVDTGTSQTEYTMALNNSLDLREVYYQGRTGDTNDNRWIKIEGWKIEKTGIGSADLLILPFQYVTGRDIMLVGMQDVPDLDDPGDSISESVHPNLIVYEGAVKMLEWRASQPGNDPNIKEHLYRLTEKIGADGLTKIERARASHKIFAPPKQSKLLTLGRKVKVDQFTYPGP